ncbi:MAG TPA: hypothetical protein VIJ10_19870 [Vicinamibacteria bacterium]|jgi:hypothetical protein
MRSLFRTFLLTLVAAVTFGAAGDASPPQEPAPTPSPTPSPAAAAGRTAPPGDIPDFVPTEKLSADDAVAFPTDI